MATIREIANKANVSPSTVSRVLNNDATLSVMDDTRQKILEIAKDLDYKTVQTRKSKQKHMGNNQLNIGIILCQSVEEELSDPYFLSIRQGIENECMNHGISNSEIFRFHQINADQFKIKMDGLIVVGKVNAEEIERFSLETENIVYVDHSPDEDKYDAVVIDFVKATHRVIDYLLSLEYKKIGYIGARQVEHFNRENLKYEDERKATFEKRMHQEGLYKAKDIHVGEFTMSEGYRLMKEAIGQGNLPEAFYVASDPMAIGALRALQEANLHVPQDVALVSVDDIEMAKFASTPLTTVKVQTKLMGSIGAKLLLDRMNGRDIPLKVIVPTELAIRESCGAVVKKGNKVSL